MELKSMKQLSLALFMMCSSMDYGWSIPCDLFELTPNGTRFDQNTKKTLLQSCPIHGPRQWSKESCINCKKALSQACDKSMNPKALNLHCFSSDFK
jgi:hypothetical protein